MISDSVSDSSEQEDLLDPDIHWHLVGKNGINIRPAWSITQGSPEVSIAIIDDGFLPNSKANEGCTPWFKYLNFSRGAKPTNDHGTAVASLINTCPKNPLNLIGINRNSPNFWLEHTGIPITNWHLLAWALDKFDCKNKTIIDCSETIGKRADIINMSLNVKHYSMEAVLTDTINLLNNSWVSNNLGTIWVASAGNDGRSANKNFPSWATGVISAGATDRNGKSAKFSNWGTTVEIMAPGVDVRVAAKEGVIRDEGTSFAAPIITGVISLMKSVYKELNWKTAVYFLQSTAVPMNCDDYCVGRAACIKDCCIGEQQVCTPGRVDAGAAVLAAQRAAAEGLPKVALVDSDRYFVDLRRDSAGVFGSFWVRNVGGKPGHYTIESHNEAVVVHPTEIDLAESGKPGDSIRIDVYSNQPNARWTYIRIASPESRRLPGFADELIISTLPAN